MERQSSIRRATDEDAPSIARLSALLGYPADASALGDRLRALKVSPTDLILVAVDAEGIVRGWMQAHAATIVETGFRVEITGLIVEPELRRSGVGRALVQSAEEWAGSLGSQVVVVRSDVERSDSHAFYPALGYKRSKTQHVYRKSIGPG